MSFKNKKITFLLFINTRM